MTECCGVMCCGVVWCGVVWCDVLRCGVEWCAVLCTFVSGAIRSFAVLCCDELCCVAFGLCCVVFCFTCVLALLVMCHLHVLHCIRLPPPLPPRRSSPRSWVLRMQKLRTPVVGAQSYQRVSLLNLEYICLLPGPLVYSFLLFSFNCLHFLQNLSIHVPWDVILDVKRTDLLSHHGLSW